MLKIVNFEICEYGVAQLQQIYIRVSFFFVFFVLAKLIIIIRSLKRCTSCGDPRSLSRVNDFQVVVGFFSFTPFLAFSTNIDSPINLGGVFEQIKKPEYMYCVTFQGFHWMIFGVDRGKDNRIFPLE